MIFTMLNHHLRRSVSSRPVIFRSPQQTIYDAIKSSKACSSPYNQQFCNPYQTTVPSSKFSNHTIKVFTSESLHKHTIHSYRKYSVLSKNFDCNKLGSSSINFSPKLSSGNSSKLVTVANSSPHRKDNKPELLALEQFNEGLVLVREGHHLSRNQHCPFLSTHKLQGFQHGPLNTPGNLTQQTRGINVPKIILDSSPKSFQPYLELIRFDKPIGTWLLYWPCTWSIALAAQPGCLPNFYLIALFGAGAFFMRGAGCIINDMWDKDFDIKVERTKERPLACDKVTYPQALVFLASQLGISLTILLQLNWYSIGLGLASIPIVITYPIFKRFTYWPQIVLGFAFNYGALLGWAAVRGSCDWSICIPLYFMCHMWTMVYDTIYAHQDKTDDILVGVKSTALRFGDQTKPWLAGFTASMAAGLLFTGHMTDMTWPYYTGATLTIASIMVQLYRLDINNPQACGDAFRFHFYMGLLMFVSITLGNLAKPKKEEAEVDGGETKEAVALM